MVIGLGSITSQLLGLLRYRLLASTLGASRQFDIYVAAFRVPDFIYALLILGSISAAFIPIFAALRTKKEQEQFISATINVISVAMFALCSVLFILAPILIDFIVPGFKAQDKAMTTFLTRIMLLQPILLAISNILTNVLQSFKKFLITAFAPAFYNIGIIIGIFLSVPHLGSTVNHYLHFNLLPGAPIFGLEGLAYGVVLGALLQLLIQLPAFFALQFSWQPILDMTREVKQMFVLMGPRILGVASDQINLIVITAIASTLSLGSITIFNLAQNIQAAPMGIIGIAIATAVFPTLSQIFSKEEYTEFVSTLLHSFRLILFFSIPLSLLFILLRAQIIRVILGAGVFGWQETRLTAAALGIFSTSLFAQSLTPLITRAYYSMHDTKTPVLIGMVGFTINIVLSFVLVGLLAYPNVFSAAIIRTLKLNGIGDIRVIALPIAFSLTVICEFLLLFITLLARVEGRHIHELNRSWLKMVAAALVMAVVTYLSLRPLAGWLDMTTAHGIFFQGLGAGILGTTAYMIITKLFKENPLI